MIYRSKIIRLKCSLNRSYISYGELHCDSVTINSSLVFFQREFWVFWPERVVPPNGNSLWTVLLLPLCDQIACYVPTEKPMSIRPVNSQCSRQWELASGSDAQRVLWNGGPKCLSTGLFGFPSSYPARPKACSQAIVSHNFLYRGSIYNLHDNAKEGEASLCSVRW